eukprot:g67072.t1
MLIISLFLPVPPLMLFRPLVPLSLPLNGIKHFLVTLFSGPLALILPLILLSLQLSTINLLILVFVSCYVVSLATTMTNSGVPLWLMLLLLSPSLVLLYLMPFRPLKSLIRFLTISFLPPYRLMHTLRITPPEILLPILDRFHLRLFRSVLDCFGVCPAAFASLPSYFCRAVSTHLFLPCRLGGFKLPDLPMLAPIAYAASISQSLPRILPILRMAAPDYLLSFTHPDLDLELDDPVIHPMFLEIASTIDRLRFLQRAFPTSSHSNSSSLPISLDNVLPMCSTLSDVSEPITFFQFLYHFSDITSPYLSEYIQLRGRSKHNAHLEVFHLSSQPR